MSISAFNKPSLWKSLFASKTDEKYCITFVPVQPSVTTLQVPIIIGKYEAMNIAAITEELTTTMPLTSDLFKAATDAFGYSLNAITIDKLYEGIFHCTMQYSSGEKRVELHARVSDAVMMALKSRAPIYISDAIFNQVSIPLAS